MKKNIALAIVSALLLGSSLAIGYSYYSGGDIYLAMLSAQSTLNEQPNEKDKAMEWLWNETGCSEYQGNEFTECVSNICNAKMPSDDNYRHIVNYIKSCHERAISY